MAKTLGFGRIFILIFFLFLMETAISGQSGILLTESEKKWLSEHRQITFVSQSDYPPFEFINENKRSDGMMIELARWIATEMGIKADFIDMPFLEAQQSVLDGRADVLTSFFYSSQRETLFNFTPMIWQVPGQIFVSGGQSEIRTVNDLEGKRIAIQRGDYAEEFLKSGNINFILYPTESFEEAIFAVIDGKADSLIGDQQVVTYELYKHDLLDHLKMVDPPLYTGQNCMATRDGNKILQSILNKGVNRAWETGTIDRITEKWLGSTPFREKSFFERNLSVFIGLLVFSVLLLLSILLWNLQLQRVVSIKAKKLAENEIQLRTIFNSIPDLLWIKDPDGSYLGCNPAFESFLGVKESQMLGKRDYDFMPEKLADFFRRNDREAIHRGSPQKSEEQVVFASEGCGEILETTKTPFYNSQGDLLGVLGIAHSITDRVAAEKKLKEQEIFLSSIIENIPDAVFVQDVNTLKYIRVNKAAEHFFNLPREDIQGKNTQELLTEEQNFPLEQLKKHVIETHQMKQETIRISWNPEDEEKIFQIKIIPVFDNEEKSLLYLLSLAIDITEYKHTEELLEIQRDLSLVLGNSNTVLEALKETLHAILNISDVTAGGIYLYNPDTDSLELDMKSHRGLAETFIRISSSYARESGQFKIVMKGKPLFLSYEDLLEAIKFLSPAEKEERLSIGLKATGILPFVIDGELIGCLNIASTIRNEFSRHTKYSIEAILSETVLILERIKLSTERENIEEQLLTAIETIDEGFSIYNSEDKLIYSNAKYMDFIPSEDIRKFRNMSFEDITRMRVDRGEIPAAADDPEKWISERIQHHRSGQNSLVLRLKDSRWMRIKEKKMRDGSTVGFRIDITSMKQSEEEIRKALQEKEILLKEIHHRVKNNMQVVTSLLSLQSEKITDMAAKDAFTEAQNRVRSMSLVHEVLYQSGSLNKIDMQSYLEKLSDQMHYMFYGNSISVQVSAYNLELEIQYVVPLGLIVTELLTNSLKHAYGDMKNGIFRIEVEQSPDRGIKATIEDNGKGIPEDTDLNNLNSLGLLLVKDLIEEQLEGSWSLDTSHGTRWTIEWKI